MTAGVSFFCFSAAASLVFATSFPCTTVFGYCGVTLMTDRCLLCSTLPFPYTSASLSCAIGSPGAASFCSTWFLLEGVSAYWFNSGVASGRSCCSLFSFCFVGASCSLSPWSASHLSSHGSVWSTKQSGMICHDCTFTRSCFTAPIACSLTV